jgi:hypothetical protein
MFLVIIQRVTTATLPFKVSVKVYVENNLLQINKLQENIFSDTHKNTHSINISVTQNVFTHKLSPTVTTTPTATTFSASLPIITLQKKCADLTSTLTDTLGSRVTPTVTQNVFSK